MVVPPDTPVMTPDNEPIVAMVDVLIYHVPPDDPSLKLIVEPGQTALGVKKLMAGGLGFTVITEVVIQPVGSV